MFCDNAEGRYAEGPGRLNILKLAQLHCLTANESTKPRKRSDPKNQT